MKNPVLLEILGKFSEGRREREEKRNAYKLRIASLKQTVNSHSQPIILNQHTKHLHPPSHQINGKHSHQIHKECKIEQRNQQHKVSNVRKQFEGVHHQKNSQSQAFIPETVQQMKEFSREEQTELQFLLNQNKELLKETVELENAERDSLASYKKIIHEIRDKYLLEVGKMKSAADQRTSELHEKALKIRLQMEAATKKNQDLQQANQQLKAQIVEGNSAMGKQMTLIKQSYAVKLDQVEKIFNSSNDKIQSFEKQFNQDQLVQNTICNQQFLANLEITAKQAEQGQGLLEQYKNLISGKKEVLDELKKNNTMKEEEIKKLANIEVRMKDIARRVTEDKLLLMKQNQKIVEELNEIKQLMMGKQ